MKPNHQKKRFVTRQKDNSFESNGPGGKQRGQPHQLMERYMMLGKETLSARDPLLAENYFQYAEHYRRLAGTQKAERPPVEEERRVRQEGGERSLGRAPLREDDRVNTERSNASERSPVEAQEDVRSVIPEERPQPRIRKASAPVVRQETTQELPPFVKKSVTSEGAQEAENATDSHEELAAPPKKPVRRRRTVTPKKTDPSE